MKSNRGLSRIEAEARTTRLRAWASEGGQGGALARLDFEI